MTDRKALQANALHVLMTVSGKSFFKDDPLTLEALSVRYRGTRKRVRQIEIRAFEKVQKAMSADIADRRVVIRVASQGSIFT